MLISTRAIVLKHYKYSENSIICKIYTEELGIKSYLINNVHNKKSKIKIGLFQPLTLLDLVVYNKENKQLQHIKEVSCTEPLMDIQFNILKSTMALFIAEIVLKTIKEEETNPVLYSFIRDFIKNFEQVRESYSDYHLIFLLNFTQYLGFYPKTESYSDMSYFDMIEGRFYLKRPLHSSYIENQLSYYMHQLLQIAYSDSKQLKLNGKIRQQLLEKIIMYYKIHLEGIGTIHSAEILKMVFSDVKE